MRIWDSYVRRLLKTIPPPVTAEIAVRFDKKFLISIMISVIDSWISFRLLGSLWFAWKLPLFQTRQLQGNKNLVESFPSTNGQAAPLSAKSCARVTWRCPFRFNSMNTLAWPPILVRWLNFCGWMTSAGSIHFRLQLCLSRNTTARIRYEVFFSPCQKALISIDQLLLSDPIDSDCPSTILHNACFHLVAFRRMTLARSSVAFERYS